MNTNKEKTKIVVTGLIENDKNQYLISQRYDSRIPKAHLKWDFIGGAIDFGESAEEAFKREIMEESGLRVSVHEMIPKCFTKVWDHDECRIHAIVLCYRCKLIDGELHLNDRKINELKWISKQEFSEYDFLPSIHQFLEAAKF